MFQAITLSGANFMDSLADATVNLWNGGHKVHFWPHHRSQTHEYQIINQPPYQFGTSRHWLSWVDAPQTSTAVDASKPVAVTEDVLLCLTGFGDNNTRDAKFSVDPLSKEYEFYVQGHAVLAKPLCPAPLYIELVSRAAMFLMT